MAELRDEEEWARSLVERELGVPVVQHDDGSRDGMHDLDIIYKDGSIAAMEVTAAADAETIELWQKLNGGDELHVVEGLHGGWLVQFDSSVRVNRVLREVETLLAQLEELGVRSLGPTRGHRENPLYRSARKLGVYRLSRHETSRSGSVYFTVRRPFGMDSAWLSETSDGLVPWVEGFLEGDQCRDVLQKLHRSGFAERHVFLVFPQFSSAPADVSFLLVGDGVSLPTVTPRLPSEVTHLWVVSQLDPSGGLRWSPSTGWSRFEKRVAEERG